MTVEFVVGYVALLGLFYGVSVYLEKSAAMRGSHRKALPRWVDKGLRLFFLFVLMYPLLFMFPYLTIPPLLLYLPSYVDDAEKTGTRLSERLIRSSVFKFIKWYFSLEIVVPYGKLDPKKQYVIAVHPHGFIPLGTLVNLLSRVNDIQGRWLNGVKLRTLAASFCFYIPGYRDFILGGGVIDAARYNAQNALAHGFSLALVPGGASEALYAMPGRNTLVLKKRKGFVKLAIEAGADLVPVYSFGENDCYNQLASVFPVFSKIQAKFQKVFGLSLPIVTNIIPRRAKISTVVGKPMAVRKNPNPSDEEVEEVLTEYIAKLSQLFYEHCDKYIEDPEKRKLEIL